MYPVDSQTPDYSQQYAVSFNEIAPGIVEWANSFRAVGETLIDSIARVRTAIAMSDAQRAMLDIQLQRAQAGLPPLSMQQNSNGNGLMILALIALVLFMASRDKGNESE
ncbi:MAG: hypothetical protein E6Q97_24840 [Desulfurellales bacterium]|nr:MAG: hypothetical protein E6Q97_24840 [Desulfurellales bacterium]